MENKKEFALFLEYLGMCNIPLFWFSAGYLYNSVMVDLEKTIFTLKYITKSFISPAGIYNTFSLIQVKQVKISVITML